MVHIRLIFAFAFLTLAAAAPLFTSSPGDEGSEWQRFSERCASDSLRTLPSAAENSSEDQEEEAPRDYRANDRDWCNVTEFWTADASVLYTLTSASSTKVPVNGEAIRLIELSIASADELHELARDFRGCDRDDVPIGDFWTSIAEDLYRILQK